MAEKRKRFNKAAEEHIEKIMKVYDIPEVQEYLFSIPIDEKEKDPTDYKKWAEHIKISSKRNNQSIKDSYK